MKHVFLKCLNIKQPAGKIIQATLLNLPKVALASFMNPCILSTNTNKDSINRNCFLSTIASLKIM